MRRNRIAWLVLLPAALGLYLFENNTGTRALLAAAALLPPLGAAYLYLPRFRVSASLALPETLRRGAEAEGILTLENAGALPLVDVRAELHIDNLLTGETAVLPVTAALRGTAAREFPFSLCAAHCGMVQVSVPRLTLSDPLGLFSRALPVQALRTAPVPPEPYPVAVSLAETADALRDSETYSAQKPGYDPGETFRIREYLPGDPVRQIHWKLSEKADKTLVREFGLPVAERMLLLLDAGAATDPGTLDGMLDLLFSLSEALLAADVSHTVGWGSYTELEISTGGDLTALRTLLLSSPPSGAVDGFLEAHEQCAYAHVAIAAAAPVPDASLLCRGSRVTVLLPAGADAAEDLSSGVITRFYAPEDREFLL